MRESLFIKRNKERWQQLQELPGSRPDEMAEEFTQLVEDLGYSKTFYPYSGITKYLNTEASRRYVDIYANQKKSKGYLVYFFKYRLPLVLAKHEKILLISLALFILFVSVGLFSAAHDENFIRQIMGDEYVNMTEKNITEGHPFGVYGYGNEVLSFLGIFLNNLKVSLIEFGGGIILGIPTVISLMQNSVMVGAFEYMFYSKGLMQDSLLTILIHGTLELSMFVISAAAGLVIARSWLFPGTVSRMDALKQGAKEGLIIALSVIPFLFIAAFFEGFVTRHSDMSVWLKLLIIIPSFFLVTSYYIFYPLYLKRKLNKTLK